MTEYPTDKRKILGDLPVRPPRPWAIALCGIAAGLLAGAAVSILLTGCGAPLDADAAPLEADAAPADAAPADAAPADAAPLEADAAPLEADAAPAPAPVCDECRTPIPLAGVYRIHRWEWIEGDCPPPNLDRVRVPFYHLGEAAWWSTECPDHGFGSVATWYQDVVSFSTTAIEECPGSGSYGGRMLHLQAPGFAASAEHRMTWVSTWRVGEDNEGVDGCQGRYRVSGSLIARVLP